MTRHPDFLHRFIPAPYVFNVAVGHKDVRIESNHLDIAFRLRRHAFDSAKYNIPVLRWKVIRDESIRGRLENILILDSGSLRTLIADPGTILIHDSARSELFGFLPFGVDLETVIEFAFPLLIEKSKVVPDLLQRSDKEHIDN